MYWRYEGIVREQWAHTAELLAMLFNCHRSESAPAASGKDFNPTISREIKVEPKNATPQDLEFCRQVFGKRG